MIVSSFCVCGMLSVILLSCEKLHLKEYNHNSPTVWNKDVSKILFQLLINEGISKLLQPVQKRMQSSTYL